MVDSVNDRTLKTAGDAPNVAGLWDAYLWQREIEFRQMYGPYAVPSKDELKQWVREAQALTQELGG